MKADPETATAYTELACDGMAESGVGLRTLWLGLPPVPRLAVVALFHDRSPDRACRMVATLAQTENLLPEPELPLIRLDRRCNREDNCGVRQARPHSPCGLTQPMNTFPS
jgi:hypothetical protein